MVCRGSTHWWCGWEHSMAPSTCFWVARPSLVTSPVSITEERWPSIFFFSPQFPSLFLFLYLRMVCVRARARGGSCKMREESLFSCLFTKCSFSVTWPLSSCWSKSSTRASHERCWKSSVNGLDLYMQCKIPWRVAIPRWRRVSDTPVTD